MLKLVAPMVGGVEASDGTWIAADEKIDGGPSVLFDAVASCCPRRKGRPCWPTRPTARDFVADAFAHLNSSAYADAALPLLERPASRKGTPTRGSFPCARPRTPRASSPPAASCGFWQREALVKRV